MSAFIRADIVQNFRKRSGNDAASVARSMRQIVDWQNRMGGDFGMTLVWLPLAALTSGHGALWP